jgi:hypothetical protein
MLAFWPSKFLGFIGSQIKIEHVHSFVGLLIALWSCCLQVENLDRIIIAQDSKVPNQE